MVALRRTFSAAVLYPRKHSRTGRYSRGQVHLSIPTISLSSTTTTIDPNLWQTDWLHPLVTSSESYVLFTLTCTFQYIQSQRDNTSVTVSPQFCTVTFSGSWCYYTSELFNLTSLRPIESCDGPGDAWSNKQSLKGTCTKHVMSRESKEELNKSKSHSQGSESFSKVLKCSGHRLLRRTAPFPGRTWTTNGYMVSLSSTCLVLCAWENNRHQNQGRQFTNFLHDWGTWSLKVTGKPIRRAIDAKSLI